MCELIIEILSKIALSFKVIVDDLMSFIKLTLNPPLKKLTSNQTFSEYQQGFLDIDKTKTEKCLRPPSEN